MDRRRTPPDIEAAVLVKSARSCTLCFHLSGDLGEKRGQIAHIDKDPSNWLEDNLAYLCLDHHTLFDSKSSQHKNYTILEVRTARSRLYQAIAQGKHHPSQAGSFTIADPMIVSGRRFFEQLGGLADTEIVRQIWAQPRWRIWIGPTEFMDARFQNLSSCRQFVYWQAVRYSPNAKDFPETPFESIEEDPRGEWIAAEEEATGNPKNLERWVLFRSGQFVLNRALAEYRQLEDSVHILSVRRVVAQAFEFAKRMAHANILTPEAVVRIELHHVAGYGLFVPDSPSRYWGKRGDLILQKQIRPEDLEAKSHELARETAMEIYGEFGCTDPPSSLLADDQRRYSMA